MAHSSRFQKTVTRILIFAVRHHKMLLLTLAVLSAASPAVLCRVRFGSDVTSLLPPGSESERGFRMLRKCGLAETVRIEIFCPDGAERAASVLDRAAAALAECPFVREVEFRTPVADPPRFLAELAGYAPCLAEPPAIREEELRRQARVLRRMLVSPAGGAALVWTRDWSGTLAGYLGKLAGLRELSGIAWRAGSPFPVSQDGKYALITAVLAESCTDPVRAEESLEELQTLLRRVLPDGFTFQIHAPHRHAVENGALLKCDVRLATWGALGILLLIFCVLYRGAPSSLLLPLLPLPAALLALGSLGLVSDHIDWFVVGLGGGVAGIAVDQTIHVYAARRGIMGVRRVARITGSLLLGGLTSVGVFALLLASDIPAYRATGWFAGGALLLNLLFSLLLLPGCLGTRGGRELPGRLVPECGARLAPGAAWLLWIGLLACGAVLWGGVGRDFSAEAFDGTSEPVLQAEKAFHERWGSGRSPDMILLETASVDEALAQSRVLAETLEKSGVPALGAGSFCPERAERERRRTAWRKWFETGEFDRAAKLWRTILAEYGLPPAWSAEVEAGWRRCAFEGNAPSVRLVMDRLARPAPGGGRIAMVLFPEGEENRAAAHRAARAVPGAAVLSPRRFGALLARDWCRRVAALLAAAFGGVALAAWGYFRSFRLAALALVPVLTMLAGVGIALFCTGLKLNLIAGISGILLAGLTIDYGVFAVTALNEPALAPALRKAMAASAWTTAAATGILLFTRHPVLFQTGVMLCSGVASAALGALFFVPKLAACRVRRSAPALLLSLAAWVFATGCRSTEEFGEVLPLLEASESGLRAELAAWREGAPAPGRLDWHGVMELGGHRLPLLAVGKGGGSSDALTIAVVTPLGVKMFELEGEGGELVRYEISRFLRQSSPRGAAESLYGDCRMIFCGNFPELSKTSALEFAPDHVTFTVEDAPDGTTDYFFAGRPLRLVRKLSRDFRGRRRQTDFALDDWRRGTDGRWRMKAVRFRNFRLEHSLTLHEKEAEDE